MKSIQEKYRMVKDFHTHTKYSRMGLYLHAKGTIMENVQAAHECGLEELAITDHGPREMYGLDPKKLPQMREEIAEAMAKYTDVKVYLGVEANIIDSPNGIDVEPEDIKDYDFINAGFHYGAPHCRSILNWIAFHLPCPQLLKDKMSEFNTEIALRALNSNEIKVLTHPGDKAYIDIEALAKACEARGTIVEINARHQRPNVEDLKVFAKHAVKFIIGSDAHKPCQVGRYVQSVELALAAGIDITRIVNIVER